MSKVLGIVTEAMFIMACKYGVGKHFLTLNGPEIFEALKFSWIGIYTGLVGTLVGKSAIVAILYQVATPTQLKRKMFLLGVCTFNVVIGSTQLVLSVNQCTPYYKLWYLGVPGNCDRKDLAFKFGYFQGGMCQHMCTLRTILTRHSGRGSGRLYSGPISDHNRMEPPSISSNEDWILRPHGRRSDVSRNNDQS